MGYSGIIITSFILLSRVLKSNATGGARSLAIGTLGAQIAILIHGLTDAALWSAKLAWMPWLLPVIAVLLYQKTEEKSTYKSTIKGKLND